MTEIDPREELRALLFPLGPASDKWTFTTHTPQVGLETVVSVFTPERELFAEAAHEDPDEAVRLVLRRVRERLG